MNEHEFIEALKKFCAKHKFQYKGRINFMNGQLLVYIFGIDCIEPFDNWLSSNTKTHSTPCAFDDAIGSYIEL